MKYCFLTTGSWEAAGFIRFRALGVQLLCRGHRVLYIVDDVPYNRNELPLELDPAAEIHFIEKPAKLGQIRRRRALLKFLNPDFVHVLNPSAKAFLALAGQRDLKVIGDWDEWPAGRPAPVLKKRREIFLDRWLRRRAHRVVVCSRYLQLKFKNHFGIEAAYIPYATYLSRQERGESPFTVPTIVYMGRLYPAYDQDLIFHAADLLHKRGQSPSIYLLGGGPELAKWQQYVKDNGLMNVTVQGFVSEVDMWRCLRHAHALVFPIRPTELNLCRCPAKTFAYAQACRPVITSRVGEVPEVLGDKAIYVEPTAEAFADAIDRIMKQTTEDVDYQVERHNWSARADSLLAVLQFTGAAAEGNR